MSIKIEDGTFAEACYNDNSIEELIQASKEHPDETDMKAWNITAAQWRENIALALAKKREDQLEEILERIKEENDSRDEDQTISDDDTNDVLLSILQSYDLNDDEDQLCEAFGISGLHSIRDAEQGIY